eukprot:CAMPEP_0114984012 /NCGR_PEP_ID=MMETSP0216-20121206/7032_1 /TAXON_ID=223996 /ORGANISM="Protocruzia adherens, Strain Boccale" /LENGTH=1227 /DNA_ID=CAMNT_0002346085 /DNA_START=54 /DNA_END=3737 /DNA_ORIENTATION=-
MKTYEIWSEQIKPPENQNITNVIWSIAFKPDGSQIIMAVGDRVFMYDSNAGDFVTSLRGHKESVYCVTYAHDGRRFASGGADKQVVIWSSSGEGILRYSHNDTIQCLDYNPTTHQLCSGTASDFGLWYPDQKSVQKIKTPAKVLCCNFTPDGLLLALGLGNGIVQIRDKNGQEKVEIRRSQPVWCLQWNPARINSNEGQLIVGCWDGTLSFWESNGSQIGQDKNIGFDPTCVNFFGNGEFMVVAGSNKKATLWTNYGVMLGTIAEKSDWIWACAARPSQNSIAIGTNNGTIAMYQLSFNIIHGLYQDRYAYRELMTDVIIQHLVTEQKVRIKCRDYVKKIALYKDRLAVQLPDKVIIYTSSEDDAYDMRYKAHQKILKKLDCSLLVVTSFHIILCQDNRLQLYNFTGGLEKEWTLESLIRYMKVVGGPAGREGLLVGLKSGQIVNIFIDNPFPITLIQQDTPIRCLDMSANRKQLAVVDDQSNLFVYDLVTKQMRFQESNANSVAWNSEMEEMLAFTGNNSLSIKTGDFPPSTQRLQGFVVGFKGSKIFCLHYVSMNTVDVPQSASLFRYIEKKDFKMAYAIACLGVTEQDWRSLGLEAMKSKEFIISRKAFIRIRDLRHIDFLNTLEQEIRSKKINESIMLGEIAAYQGHFAEAAKRFEQAGATERAVELWTDLKQFERIPGTGSSGPSVEINRQIQEKQAEWDVAQGRLKKGATILIGIKQYKKAIELLGPGRNLEQLAELCRSLTKADNEEEIRLCAHYFKKFGHHQYAKEAYLKLGDTKALMGLHVELNKWEDAFNFASANPSLKKLIYLPYAEWLQKNDRFDEAQDAYKNARRPDLAMKMTEKLTQNAVTEGRFNDAGYYFWLLAQENLKLVNSYKRPDEKDHGHLRKSVEFQDMADIYYAYHTIHKYIEEPFQTVMFGTVYNTSIFNASRFLLNKLGKKSPVGISKVYIYYALGKLGAELGAFKTARFAYERLQTLRIPSQWQEEVDLAYLSLRCKPFSDKESLMPICNRCMGQNPLLNMNSGDRCVSCGHPFIRSFISFDTLSLVEFVPEDGISDEEAMKLIKHDDSQGEGAGQRSQGQGSRKRGGNQDGWQENTDGNEQMLTFNNSPGYGGGDDLENNIFMDKMMEFCDQNVANDYRPVPVDQRILASLKEEDVFIVDNSEICPSMPKQFFKNMVPDFPIHMSPQGKKFFLQDEFEYAYLEKDCCPYSRCKDTAPEDDA